MNINTFKIGLSIFLTAGLWSSSLQAQVEPVPQIEPAYDSTSIELAPAMEEAPAIQEDYYGDEIGVVEAYTEPNYYKLNAFKHNSKLKPIENPDQKARYSGGIMELLDNLSKNLTIPYNYSNISVNFVLVKVVVGADSSLYNPEILSTPGSSYSINAQEAIEKLPGKFIPAMKNGKPVESILIIPIRFETRLNSNYNHYDRF